MRLHRHAIILATILTAGLAFAQDPPGSVRITVTGIEGDDGRIICALFSSSKDRGFPLDVSAANRVRRSIDGRSVVCEWTGLKRGYYAVSAAHDVNDNGKCDVNFLGVPIEAWAASNNARPVMRAPAFLEARFLVSPGDTVTQKVQLKYP